MWPLSLHRMLTTDIEHICTVNQVYIFTLMYAYNYENQGKIKSAELFFFVSALENAYNWNNV